MRMLWLVVLVGLFVRRGWGATYYLSPGGSDAAAGTSVGAAWLSPHHALQCGDVVVAVASGAYDYRNFQADKWGKVRCPAANNVAWLKCERFDACKIAVGPVALHVWGMQVTKPFWGVQGWEVTNLSANGHDTGSCFDAAAHHVIFANDVVNGCGGAGIGVSVDYGVAVGNLVYSAARTNTDCHSGIGAYSPAVYDRAAGTHIYIAGNFVWGTTNPEKANCYDGNGISSDWMASHRCSDTFAGRVVIENNVVLSNGGVGIRTEYSGAENYPNGACGAWKGPAVFSEQIVRRNTVWNNGIGCYALGSRNGGELQIEKSDNVHSTGNLAVAVKRDLYCDPYPSAGGGFPLGSFARLAAAQVADGSSRDSVEGNWLYSVAGNAPQIANSQGRLVTDSTFVYGANVVGMDPQLAHAFTPGEPRCGGAANTVACMAEVIRGFRPRNARAAGYGYQLPVAEARYDPLFPEWLCHVGLPPGLVTMGCVAEAPVAGGRRR